ncbi:MAG TPA: hypothetical protein VLZ09_01585 [Gaiellaceae bacterium]|nr:hypothetical protein [Gaiellaceae bacterium]
MTASEAAAAVDVDAADATAAEVGKHQGAPVLVEARAQALLIAALRLALAAAGVAAAVARGVERGPAVGLLAFGAGLVLFSVYAGGKPQRAARRFGDAQPAPNDFRVERPLRALAAATYPSTIGLTVLTVIALWPQPPLAAFLAGILAGLGVMALVGVARLRVWERARRSRFYVDAKSEQVFEAMR